MITVLRPGAASGKSVGVFTFPARFADGAPGPLREGLTVLFPPLANHSFQKIEFQPPEAKKFFSTVRKEMALLATSLPEGIMVKTFEDRMASRLGMGRCRCALWASAQEVTNLGSPNLWG